MAYGQNITPIGGNSGEEEAVALIRQKVARLYGQEPDAVEELKEAAQAKSPSKHQVFMQELSKSGKDLATIQTEWHNYYQGLGDEEKRQVWQEFYSNHQHPGAAIIPAKPAEQPAAPIKAAKVERTESGAVIGSDPHVYTEHKHEAASAPRTRQARHQPKKAPEARSADAIRATIRNKVSAGGKLSKKDHLRSLAFGLSMGLFVMFITLFGFFNEVVLANIYQPGRNNASTQIIVGDSSSITAGEQTEVIIPKINLQLPTDYSQTTTDEKAIEAALDDKGIVHYPTTARPGQVGNASFFGHSSNNIFNKGKYKFAFVMLRTLEIGDTFYLTYEGKVYVYKVFEKRVVPPTEVSVLDPVAGKRATATLITCDPPGTSLNRLIVVGEQISPGPEGNTESAQAPISAPATQPVSNTELPGNGPTLLGRMLNTGLGKTVAVIAVLIAIAVTLRWTRGLTKE